MKFIIFADKNYNYRKPMADGLYKHLISLGHDVEILYDGNYWLSKIPLWKVLITDIFKALMNIKSKKRLYFLRFWSMVNFNRNHKNKILDADCLIVVDNCPNVYYKNCLSRLEILRKEYKGPIVNYDLHYLPNQGWYVMIKEKDSDNFGLERFDWYLPASLVTEYAIPREIPQIYNCIGFDLHSDDLKPEQDEFLAVLDFEHAGYEKERSIQIKALELTNTKYICLKGRYTRDEIRALYRKCSIFFTSVRESFSLPVIEVQLCGGIIATPYAKWLPAHFLNKSIYEKGVGTLGRNFIVYENNLETLIQSIKKCKEEFNAINNINNFRNDYPSYYSINDKSLNDFCNSVNNGFISKQKHNEFSELNKYINLNDRVKL